MPTIEFDYLSHLAKYGRHITDVDDFLTRIEQFTFIDNFVKDHNASGASWQAGHNQFSDWTKEEF